MKDRIIRRKNCFPTISELVHDWPEDSQFRRLKFGRKFPDVLLELPLLILAHWSVLCRSQSSCEGPQIVQLREIKFFLTYSPKQRDRTS